MYVEVIFETCRAIVPNMNIITNKSFYVNIVKYALPILICNRFLLDYEFLIIPFYIFLAANATLDTTILNLIASGHATQLELKCDCEEKQIIRANLASPFYYIGHLAFLQLLYYIPFVGPFIYWPLYFVLYGWNIMEYFLIKTCTFHRYKYFNAIFLWCFGIGITINFATWVTCHLFLIQNSFFYNAILNFYTTQVVMNAIFKPTLYIVQFNPFHISRSATSSIIKTMINWGLERLENNDTSLFWDKFKKIPYTFKDFAERDVCKFVIQENYKSIKNVLTQLLDLSQRKNVLKMVNYFGEMFPQLLSEKTTIAVKLLQRDDSIKFLQYLSKLLSENVSTDFQITELTDQYMRSRSPSLEWDVEGEYVVLKHKIET